MRQGRAGLREQFLQMFRLKLAKYSFSRFLKDRSDGAAFVFLDQTIEVGKPPSFVPGQMLAHGAFPGSHEADEENSRRLVIVFQ